MPLQLDDLAALDAPTLENTGQPLMLPVESIDEDPEQPRREFEDNRLEDLAETIRTRGVRQPISVRPNLQAPGRWMLNFGARRLRASKMAGMAEIPAFIDTTADSYDQVIENEQREGLRPLELALFVQKRIALGDNQAEIAKRLGKSRQWVTLATALIEPPDWLLQAYREGRCRGTNELYDLRRLHGEHGDAVEAWAAQQTTITRDRLAEFRATLERRTAPVLAPTRSRPAQPTWPTTIQGYMRPRRHRRGTRHHRLSLAASLPARYPPMLPSGPINASTWSSRAMTTSWWCRWSPTTLAACTCAR